MAVSSVKRCGRCGNEKKASQFLRGPDGTLKSYCKPCRQQYAHDYYRRNPEKFKGYDGKSDRDTKIAYLRDYYAKNRDSILAQNRQRRAENLKQHRAAELERYHTNPRRKQQLLEAGVRRKSRVRGLPTEKIDRLQIYERDGGKCHICGGTVSRTKFHLDHLIPVVHGGGYVRENLRVAHPACNIGRGAGRKPAQLLLIG